MMAGAVLTVLPVLLALPRPAALLRAGDHDGERQGVRESAPASSSRRRPSVRSSARARARRAPGLGCAFEECLRAWQRRARAKAWRCALSRPRGRTGRRRSGSTSTSRGRPGWAAARRDLPLELPGQLGDRLRGARRGGVERPRGQARRRVRRERLVGRPAGVRSSADPGQPLRLKKRHFSFAWGPLRRRRAPRASAAFEIAVTARAGGRGWIALDDLTLDRRCRRRRPSRRPSRASPPRPRGRVRAGAGLDGDPVDGLAGAGVRDPRGSRSISAPGASTAA